MQGRQKFFSILFMKMIIGVKVGSCSLPVIISSAPYKLPTMAKIVTFKKFIPRKSLYFDDETDILPALHANKMLCL